jgi:hypothetical protein
MNVLKGAVGSHEPRDVLVHALRLCCCCRRYHHGHIPTLLLPQLRLGLDDLTRQQAVLR